MSFGLDVPLPWCQFWLRDRMRRKEEKKRQSEESAAAAAASLRSAWHLQQNTGRMEWWKVEGRMKAEATALKEWNHHSERGTTGGKQHRRTKTLKVAEQIVRNMRCSILKTSAHFLIKASKCQLCASYFCFVEFQDMKCNQVEMLSASKQFKLHYSWQWVELCALLFLHKFGIKIKEIVNPKISSARLSFEDKKNIRISRFHIATWGNYE